MDKTPHAVCVPFPVQGHVIPFMKLAKILHLRGFYVTFVNTEYNHRCLIQSQGPDFEKSFHDFKFETIPEGLPPSDRHATQDPVLLCDSIRKNCLTPFRDLLSKLISSPVIPPISCIISDGMMSFAIKAAQEFGILDVQFWTASACGYMGYLQFDELRRRGIIPFKDLFAKKSLLSIASEVGKPIAIDKPTQIKSRPSTARVKVILDLMKKLPNRIWLQFVDRKYGGTPRVGVDAPRVGSGQKLMDSRQKLMDTSDVEDAEKSGQHVLQVENENATKNWTLVAHKNSTSSRTLYPTSQNNSPCSEKGGATGNFHDSEKRKDISNASRPIMFE
ncbi:hypothetical protein MTR67_013098 [Solanum verrucosum]|uniref:Uncharacterized protein n=1 Tax=Solanum verrucosum TaxID=315347 RepID=A0AAF0QBR7_SOLVR|nr:hypothetical protein MTR67_013098 [Solanum verrucosum]